MTKMEINELRKEKRKNLFFIYIIIILLIVIFILLMQKNKVCSNLDGKVDIFEVGCGENGENCTEDKQFFLTVKDDEKTWHKETKIDIFANPLYNNESIIAPLSTNTYRFVISNDSTKDIEYELNFKEENPADINMKYRLKRGEDYIVGDQDTWVYYEELNLKKLNLQIKTKQVFYLEWKWFESENDTHVGITRPNYSLTIAITSREKVA